MGDGSSQKPFKSLKYVIDNSKNDSTIYLNDGEYVGENNRNINIDKSVTLIGQSKQNTIINGESCGRLFNVTATGRLTLINITLLNGHSTENGGTIYSEGGVININNCIVKNSTADNYGGVIYNNLGTLNIENSSFTNNSAYDYGGALYTMGKTSIKNSNFSDIILTSKWGVAACIAAGGKIDLDGCIFTDSFCVYAAAGLLNLGDATINNCRFERLSTNYTAGGISNHKYMIINNSYFGYNDVQYYAAAILDYAGENTYSEGGPYVITEVYNTIFEKNHAGYHAAVSNNFHNTELHLQNCALIDNYIILNQRYGDVALDDNATMLYCWWGQNGINPYYYSRHNGENNPEKINASRWLIMTFTANDNVIYKDEVNQLTVSLKQYFDNETKEIHEYDCEFDLPLDVIFYTNVGTLGTTKLVNGVATFNFNPKDDVSVVYAKINNQILKIDNFKLKKASIIAADYKTYYGNDGKLSIKLVKENNIPLSNEKLSVNIGGTIYTVKTDKNGIAKVTVKNQPKTYTAKITYNGNNYIAPTKSVKVTVKKATPKLTAAKKTFKLSVKTKKYIVSLKTSQNKVMKNTKVTLKVKGKTYTAKTNAKGQATFKITNLKKKGTFTAVVKYAGDKNYNAKTVKPKIIVK